MEEKSHSESRIQTFMIRYIGGMDLQGTNFFAKMLFQDLEGRDVGVIIQSGFEGIGRWAIARHAAEMAKESNLFDYLIWLELSKEDHRPRNLQKRIANSVGIEFSTGEDSEDYVNDDIAEAINEKLADKRFLLVLGDVYEFIDLTAVGVPYLLKSGWMKSRTAAGSKVLFITPLKKEFLKIQHDKDFSLTITDDKYGRAAYEMVHEEAAEAARSLKTSINASYFNFTADTLIGFVMCLYWNRTARNDDPRKHKMLLRYAIAEGFVTSNTPLKGGFGQQQGGGGRIEHKTTEEEMILAERVMKPLVKALRDHSFIDADDNAPSDYYQVMKLVGRYIAGDEFGVLMRFIATISIENWSGVRILPNFLPERHINLTTLFIRMEFSQENELDIPPNFFDDMESLRVLELHYTPITSLPSSLSSLTNLRFLRLEDCRRFTAVSNSLQALKRLEFLDLSGCPELHTIPQDTFEKMSNLRHLNLSNTKIRSLTSSVSNLRSLQLLSLHSCESLNEIPEKTFENMQRLEVLNLSGCSSLKSLQSSLSKLVSLKQLYLTSCSSLWTGFGVGAHLLKNLSSLEVLDLRFCNALEDIQLQDVFFGDLVPNIRYIDLSGVKTPKQLSFRACQMLESLALDHNENLEVLELSGTTQLKHFNMNYTGLDCKYPLRRLVMLPINYRDMQDVLYQRSNSYDHNDVGADIWMTDPIIFSNVSQEVFETKCFSQFHIRVSSSAQVKPNMPMPMGSIQGIHLHGTYKQIQNSHFQTCSSQNFNSTYDRHLEIYKCNTCLKSLPHILFYAELLTLFDNNLVENIPIGKSLFDLQLKGLKECRIGSCQIMKVIFYALDNFTILEELRVMWVSDLPQLTNVCKGKCHPNSFAFLKHVHIERCPKLKTLFTDGFYLNSLETLDIKFCSRLEDVFGDKMTVVNGSLQRLESLCLWELPKLKSICKGYLPKLQKMRVRGCRKLMKLPLHVRVTDTGVSCHTTTDPVVQIEGELNWWKNLQWADEVDAIKRPVHFRPQRL